ncbi:uncharacterized protein [Clytia hemisphaerica]
MKNIRENHVTNIDFMATSHQTYHHGDQQTVTLLGLMCRIYTSTILQLHNVISTNTPTLSEVIKMKIPRETGGHLRHSENIHVKFPPNAVNTNHLNASLSVIKDESLYHYDTGSNKTKLATPIICLGPCGTVFNRHVKVTLPLIEELPSKSKQCKLLIMVSQTLPGDPPRWSRLYSHYEIKQAHNGTRCITFEVPHFSVYKVLWSYVDSTLPETIKLHASSTLSGFSFKTNFEARMTDCNHSNQFALCIIGCRESGDSEMKQQYPLQVGSCKAKKIQTGKLRIRLKSELFTADQQLGEENLTKDIDFNGHDIDAQFSCVLTSATSQKVLDLEMFGKVFISQLSEDGNAENEFSFNLIKSVSSLNLVPSWYTTLFQRSPNAIWSL